MRQPNGYPAVITVCTLLLHRCGLSHREAAEFLGVRRDTVSSWTSGRNGMPPGPMAELRRLYAAIERAAAETLAQIGHVADEPGTIELGLVNDDAEARTLGWPCVGAHEALLSLIVARSDRRVVIVPRGSTVATDAAASAHADYLAAVSATSRR